MPIKRRSGSSKNPPILSHEFFIQNHADIVSCVAMVFVLGLLFQATSPLASLFVAMSHNVTDIFGDENSPALYTYGIKDLALTFFYFLICIVMHAVIQEYFLDVSGISSLILNFVFLLLMFYKLNRKLHLSKIKHSKFNESGQLLIFYLLSVVWGVEIIRREGFVLSISKLWLDYPHLQMTYLFKFYFIIQISYWLHSFPELYFQKVKKEEIVSRVTYSLLYLVFFTAAYVLNFTRIALCLSVLHFFVEALFHASRLFYFADKTPISDYGFKLWNILFVLVRLGSITLSVLTFWYGLALHQTAVPSLKDGNFNTNIIRINSLVAVCLLQAWMMWNFITFHLKRMREKAAEVQQQKKKSIKPQKKVKKAEDDVNELPEVDQNTKKSQITQRPVAKANKGGKH
ncbi:translocating chain-associated membrane protein 1-like protein [Leptotrombidium deliense]|uniref:Translocating chain-associated membrane protein 1-like protein n=1 Tax=Leptotrombidium deliense TaxID=299467 RepID=A0A443SEA2_9ACAR|nr:translocating chain-associated membrane protein 1-like protein [Leptotrombidium deliense]